MAEATPKDLLKSKSFIGAVLLALSIALQAFGHAGFDPGPATDLVLNILDYALPILGGVLSLVGIVGRKGPIGSIGGVSVEAIKKILPLVLILLLPALGMASGGRQAPDAVAVVSGLCASGQRISLLGTGGAGHRNQGADAPRSPWGAIECPDPRLAVDLPAEIRKWYRNPDGSCVQCSGGMCGTDQNVPAAATLLWDSEYGPAERGGSGASRVSRYAKSRGIAIYNVTGRQTIDWMKWACATGRGAAIGAGGSHFQTLMGHDPATNTWWVCNNNSTHKIDEYDDASFRRLHAASGPWIWILDYPPHPARPFYFNWWD